MLSVIVDALISTYADLISDTCIIESVAFVRSNTNERFSTATCVPELSTTYTTMFQSGLVRFPSFMAPPLS